MNYNNNFNISRLIKEQSKENKEKNSQKKAGSIKIIHNEKYDLKNIIKSKNHIEVD